MKTFFQLLFAAALVAAIIGLGFLPSIPIDIGGDTTAKDRPARVAAAQSKIHELQKTYQDEVAGSTAEAERQIRDLMEAAGSRASSAASASSAPFQGFSNVSHCVLLGAKDQLTGETNLQHYTAGAMEPSIRLLSQLRADLQAVLDAHHHTVSSAANRFRRDSLAVMDDFGLSPREVAEPDFKDMVRPVSAAVSDNTRAVLSSSLEVLLIKSTLAMVHNTIKHLVTRLAGSLAAAGGSALADGPIPVGDAVGAIIAMTGTAWTAWDVRTAVKTQAEMPARVEAALGGQIDSLGTSALDAVRQAGKPADSFAVTR